ncbi:Putative DNA alkylation repair enzyme [Ignavibacterium album JCM 16511]|uniref:Putative DNA alkylation repair enzyme n=1 Tax=Ignavibacterium album (strain DSM 19864 / JCM 16511 / NBRC 101810 / Mat9-16) TaxID=945713 RepID=I0AGK8_IGNAJ|nr:DNA alkylation repair protein [Ignavibacterium album]AFH48115.1 Putative DNA alkylation repair enzyme [Ignavibacterium album JCM 16511]
MSLSELRKELTNEKNPEQAKILQRFFKTGEGEYGEGDIFYGIKVPVTRTIAKRFVKLTFNELKILLASEVHEERLAAGLILVEKFNKANEKEREKIYRFYLTNRKGINNWDLVDLTAPKVIGTYLMNRDKKILFDLAQSKNLWDRRIAIISTLAFIRKNQFDETLNISRLLLKDKHDLIHKAVGWMLREIGKINGDVETEFLLKHYKEMPRTMLRYAIEKFPERKRKQFLEGTI